MGNYFHMDPGDYRFDLEDDSLFLGYRRHATRSQNKHFHKGYELQFILSGERHMFSGNSTWFLRGRDIMLIPPETLHKSLRSPAGSEIFTLCYRPCDTLCSLLGESTLKVETGQGDFDSLRTRFERIAREFRDEGPGYTAAIKAAAEDLFVQFLRLPGFGKKSREKGEPGEASRKMMAVAEYIHSHVSDDISLRLLSQRFYISPSYLSRSFHRETGFSLVEYVNNIRILKSKTELLTTDDPIGMISERCGFGSVTNFGRIFKSITGVSPRTYRVQGGLVPE